jgi:hypothetical protein
MVSFADGIGEKSEGKRAEWGRFFGSNRAKKLDFEAKKTGFSGDFQRPNLTMWENLGSALFKRC